MKKPSNPDLPYTNENGRYSITFCGNGKCKCPAITVEGDNIILGGDDEGYTRFDKEQFKLFMNEVKNGTFDDLV